MADLYVEGWSPSYGAPFEPDQELADPGKVDEGVEQTTPWTPIDGVDDGVRSVAFVDGVRRIDARLVLDDDSGPIPGICGTHVVGAVTWDREAKRSAIGSVRVERMAVFGGGTAAPIPLADPRLSYRSEAVPDMEPQALIQRFHGAMRKAEARLSEELAQKGTFVVADGPINDLSATEKVGYIKTHRAPYLSAAAMPIIGRLGAGQRTPLFLIGKGGAFPRYSWYLRLADIAGGHRWTGVVRAEVSSHLGRDLAVTVADRTTALLPQVASQPHIDPRAPQNLVPIGALERELRRRMGDATLVHRALRSAVMRQQPSATVTP